MPITRKEKKSNDIFAASAAPTGQYSSTFLPPQSYKPVQPVQATIRSPFAAAGIPAISTRDLNYFFDIAASLYKDDVPSVPAASTYQATDAPPAYDEGMGSNSPAAQIDPSAVMVIRLFRQTATHIRPVAERFHLGPADRQPLYAVTGQPSPRSATEFNELAIKRRDPVSGVWHAVCTSDIEPSLELVKPGNWKVASLTMDSVPVWKQVVAGQVVKEKASKGRGNKLRLWWGDRATLGDIGDCYGLWWESGNEAGTIEALYLVERGGGLNTSSAGVVLVKPAYKKPDGKFADPRTVPETLAALYFHGDGTPPQFVCSDPNTHIRLDFIMAGLMTVLTIETRKAEVIKELGNLPAYGSITHWTSSLVEEAPEGEDWGAQ